MNSAQACLTVLGHVDKCKYWNSLGQKDGLKHDEGRRLTGEDPPTNWSQDAHEEDGDGHESGHLVLAQRGEGEQSCGQVEDQRGDRCPQKHSIPHLWTNTQSFSHTWLRASHSTHHTEFHWTLGAIFFVLNYTCQPYFTALMDVSAHGQEATAQLRRMPLMFTLALHNISQR